METIIVNVAWCDRNFGGSFSDNVPGAVVFTAHSFADLKQTARETLAFHIEGLIADGEHITDWLAKGDYTIAFHYMDIPTMLHACESIVTLAAISRASGINPSQLSHYANGVKTPRPEQRRRIVDGLHKIASDLQQFTC